MRRRSRVHHTGDGLNPRQQLASEVIVPIPHDRFRKPNRRKRNALVPHARVHRHEVSEAADKQQRGEPADIPLTVTVTYEDGTDEDVLVKVTDRTAEQTIPLKGRVRSIVANADNAALAIVEK